VWFANVARESIPDEHAELSVREWQQLLADLLDGDAGPAMPLIEAGVLELTAGHAYDLPRVPRWHRGPLTRDWLHNHHVDWHQPIVNT
jgi:hypothetical protein